MTQKELFEKLENIVNSVGAEKAIESIDIMFKSYLENSSKENFETVLFVKNEISELLANTKEYQINRFQRIESNKDFANILYADKNVSNKYSIPNLDVDDKNSIFYSKNVIFTGDMVNIERSIAASFVHSKGATIKESVSSKIDIVIIGSISPGPKKLQKIEDLIQSGNEIKKVYEEEFIHLMNNN